MTIANDNPQWWQVHIAGQVILYGDWEIAYNPPPIPSRNCDWQYSHKNFDGAEDACDGRYGYCGTLIEAMDEIDDMASDAWEEAGGCDVCGIASGPEWCTKRGCKFRAEYEERASIRKLAEQSK